MDHVVQITFALGFAVLFTLVIRSILRWATGPWPIAAALVAPVALLYAVTGSYRDIGYHGFMHASYTYNLFLQGGLIPEDPLFAGGQLHYPYAHHVVIAFVMRLFPITPTLGFALTNVVGLGILVIILYKAAALICSRPAFCTLAALLGVSGGPLIGGPGVGLINLFGLPREVRHLPYSKFIGFGSNQLGLLFGALVLLGLLQLARDKRQRTSGLWNVTVGLLGAGIFYPPEWMPILLCAGCSAFILLHNNSSRKAGVLTLIVILFTSVIVLPYILSITLGRSTEGSVRILSDLWEVGRSFVILLLGIGPAAILVWAKRDKINASLREKPRPMITLFIWVAVPAAMSFMLQLPLRIQYKFLASAMLPLALITAIALESFYRTNKKVALMFLFLLIQPTIWHFATLARIGWPVLDPVYTDGRYLRHRNASEDELYQWISNNTPLNAVFLDTHLTIPPLGRRPLFVGLDTRGERIMAEIEPGTAWLLHDGWGMKPRDYLELVTGTHPQLIEERQSIARAFLSPDAEPDEAIVTDLLERVDGRPVFVVVRNEKVRSHHAEHPYMVEIHRGKSATVFRIRS